MLECVFEREAAAGKTGKGVRKTGVEKVVKRLFGGGLGGREEGRGSGAAVAVAVVLRGREWE